MLSQIDSHVATHTYISPYVIIYLGLIILEVSHKISSKLSRSNQRHNYWSNSNSYTYTLSTNFGGLSLDSVAELETTNCSELTSVTDRNFVSFA